MLKNEKTHYLFKRIIPLAIASACLYGEVEGGVIDRMISSIWRSEEKVPPEVKILIVHDKPGVVLEVKGKYKLYDPNTNEFISTRFIGKRKFIQALQDGLKWGEEFPGVHQIKIVPDDPKTKTLVDGTEYSGEVIVYDIGGSISVVNKLPVDDYLNFVMGTKNFNSLSQEALNALAIVTRTNVLYHAQNSNNNFWSIEGSQVGYLGSAAGQVKGTLASAITDTSNMVLRKSGELFPAEWSSSTGQGDAVIALISLNEAEKLASDGKNASEILSVAFPGASVNLVE